MFYQRSSLQGSQDKQEHKETVDVAQELQSKGKTPEHLIPNEKV